MSKKPTYEIRYGQRKTVEIKIDKNQHIIVYAPKGMAQSKIQAFVDQHSRWINKHLTTMNHYPRKPQIKQGEVFLMEGKSLKLLIKEGPKALFEFNDQSLIVTLKANRNYSEEEVKQLIIKGYRLYGEGVLTKEFFKLAEKFPVHPTKLTLKEQKKRWGSCTSKGHILLNWRLIMAPPFVREAVMIHELCHLVHMDHSKAFWDLVRQYTPYKEESQNWLKIHSNQMYF